MKIQYLISILITFIIIISLISLIQYPKETKPTNKYEIIFTEYKLATINKSGKTNVNEPTRIFENISQMNITKTIFILIWVDDITSQSGPGGISIPFGCEDTFRLNITDPNGNRYSNESKECIIKIPINFNENLDIQIKNGKSEKDIYDSFKNENGTGKCIIDIICLETTGGGCFITDNGNDWNLTIEIYYYDGEVKKIN